MGDALRLLGRFLSLSIRAQLQYRASFVLSVVGQLGFAALELVAIAVLFSRFGGVRGWSLPEVGLFYGMIHSGFAVAEALGPGFEHFGPRFVKTGGFDRLLVRPRTTVLQLVGHELDLKRLGRFVPALVVFGAALRALDLDWGPERLALLALSLVGTVCLFLGLFVLQATLTFWTVDNLEIAAIVTNGGAEAGQYPVSIYQRWFRELFTYVVPVACVSYFPVVAILGVDDPLGTSRSFQALAPLSGVAFLLVAFGAWRLGVRHYTSTGS